VRVRGSWKGFWTPASLLIVFIFFFLMRNDSGSESESNYGLMRPLSRRRASQLTLDSVFVFLGERHRLYLGFAVTNTILRPVTCFLLYRIFRECDTERGGIRGLFGDVLDTPAGILNNFHGGRREYRGTSGTHDSTAPPPPGTVRSGYQPIDPNDPAKLYE